MSNLDTLEKEALLLSDSQRAALAASLLSSLPAVLVDTDDGLAEALRRDREFYGGLTGIRWEDVAKNLGRG